MNEGGSSYLKWGCLLIKVVVLIKVNIYCYLVTVYIFSTYNRNVLPLHILVSYLLILIMLTVSHILLVPVNAWH